MRITLAKISIPLFSIVVLPLIFALTEQKRTIGKSGLSTVSLNFTAGSGETRQLNATIWFPENGSHNDLPFLYMLNGFNVESYWYSLLMQTLASKGYLAAAVDYHQPFQFPQEQPPKPGCPNNTVDATAAGTLNVVWDYLFNKEKRQQDMPADLADALTSHAAQSLVLLGHSYGGFTSYQVLSGRCDGPSLQAGQSDPAATLDTGCYGYSPITDPSTGHNLLKGLVVYEGLSYSMPVTPLPLGTFALEISGQYKGVKEAKSFSNVTGECTTIVQLDKTNHYGLCDYNSTPDSHQITRCGAQIPGDDPNFTTSRATQEAAVALVADLADAAIKANLLQDQDSIDFLTDGVHENDRVLMAASNPACFVKREA